MEMRFDLTSETEIILRKIQLKLEELGVPYPNGSENWFHWLPRMIAWAETKNLSEARNSKPPMDD